MSSLYFLKNDGFRGINDWMIPPLSFPISQFPSEDKNTEPIKKKMVISSFCSLVSDPDIYTIFY